MIELQSPGPVVLVDERVPGIDLPAVVADSRRGAREVVTHVVQLRHERFACITGPTGLWTAELLIDRILCETDPDLPEPYPVEVKVRESTAPPAQR